MKCYVCEFDGYKEDFGQIEASGGEFPALIGRIGQQHVGSVTVYVCPQCGALHSDMRGKIRDVDRKG